MWVKWLDVLRFAVLYLAQPYQLKRQDLHDLKYFLYYTVLFVVYIPPDPISLCEKNTNQQLQLPSK